MARSKPLSRPVAAGGVMVSPGVGFRICKMGVRRPRGEPQLIRGGERPREVPPQRPGAFGSALRVYSVRPALLQGSRPLQAAETVGRGQPPRPYPASSRSKLGRLMPRALRAASTAKICGSLSAAHTPSVLQLQNNSSCSRMAPAGLGAPARDLGARRGRRCAREGNRSALGRPARRVLPPFPGRPAHARGPPTWAPRLRPGLRAPPRPAPPSPGPVLTPPRARPPRPAPCPDPSPGPPRGRPVPGPLLRPLRSPPRPGPFLTTHPTPPSTLCRARPDPSPPPPAGPPRPVRSAPSRPLRPRPRPGALCPGAAAQPRRTRAVPAGDSLFLVGLARCRAAGGPQTVPLSHGLGGYRLNPGRANGHPLAGGWTVLLGFFTPQVLFLLCFSH